MALNGTAMGTAISKAVQSAAENAFKKGGKISPDEIWIAAANEIVKHIQDNAEVNPGISVTGTCAQCGPLTGATSAPGKIS